MSHNDAKLTVALHQLQTEAPASGSTWRHYKGHFVQIMTIAVLEATLEPVVIYWRRTDARVVWARPLTQWREEVDFDGQRVPRFSLVHGGPLEVPAGMPF